MPAPGFQRKTVNGRAQVPHSRPNSCFDYVCGRRGGKGEVGFRDEGNRGRRRDDGRRAHHSDEWVVPETYWEYGPFEQEPSDDGGLEGHTCLAKYGEFTLFPTSFVDVSLGWHFGNELMENRKERWKEFTVQQRSQEASKLPKHYDSADPNLDMLTQRLLIASSITQHHCKLKSTSCLTTDYEHRQQRDLPGLICTGGYVPSKA